jgi:hypothetical protein
MEVDSESMMGFHDLNSHLAVLDTGVAPASLSYITDEIGAPSSLTPSDQFNGVFTAEGIAQDGGSPPSLTVVLATEKSKYAHPSVTTPSRSMR